MEQNNKSKIHSYGVINNYDFEDEIFNDNKHIQIFVMKKMKIENPLNKTLAGHSNKTHNIYFNENVEPKQYHRKPRFHRTIKANITHKKEKSVIQNINNPMQFKKMVKKLRNCMKIFGTNRKKDLSRNTLTRCRTNINVNRKNVKITRPLLFYGKINKYNKSE